MKKLLYIISVLLLSASSLGMNAERKKVVFAEIFYDTPLNEDTTISGAHNVGEYIKLQNISEKDVDITNWRVELNGLSQPFKGTVILPPGGVFILSYEYRMPLDYENKNVLTLFPGIPFDGEMMQLLNHYSFYLGNSRNRLNLYDEQGKLQEFVVYGEKSLIARNAIGTSAANCVSVRRKSVDLIDEVTGTFDISEYYVGKASPYSKEDIEVIQAPDIPADAPNPFAPFDSNQASIRFGNGFNFSHDNNFTAESVLQIPLNEQNGTVTAENARTSVSYFDGLGRIRQKVHVGAGNNSDIANFYEYDSRGMLCRQWLPAQGAGNGSFCELSELAGSYTELYPDNRECFYSSTVYNGEPEALITNTIPAGDAWQDSDGTKLAYRLSSSSGDFSALDFTVDRKTKELVKKGNHPAGSLKAVQLTDEDGHRKIVFRDRKDSTVLVRRFSDEATTADTYYVYDVAGNLRYVIPPEATVAFSKKANGTIKDSDEDMGKFCFVYKYDNKQRMIEKKIPGAEPVSFVYDQSNLLIYSQDGNQRQKNEYTYFVYDRLRRLLYSGTVVDSRGISSLRSLYKSKSTRAKYVGSSGVYGYNQIITYAKKADIKNVYYYDNYAFLDLFSDLKQELSYEQKNGYDSKYTAPIGSQSAKGLMTGSLCRVLDNENTVLVKSMYYDSKSRIIQSHESNYMGGVDSRFFKLSFPGNPLEERHEHSTADTLNVDTYRFVYDRLGRLLSQSMSHDGEEARTLSEYTYNSLSQIASCTMGNAYVDNTISYSYNVRGWLKQIESPFFVQTLNYEKKSDNSKGLLNGNVSEMTWANIAGDEDRTMLEARYAYSYDGMNRLLKAGYKELQRNMSTSLLIKPKNPDNTARFSYDRNSNITSLSRKGYLRPIKSTSGIIFIFGTTDSLEIKRNGNQLKKILDSAEDTSIGKSMDFNDGADADTEYTWDANGNMTSDANKGITLITYNYLNLPQCVRFKDNHAIDYIWDSNGRKLRTVYRIVVDKIPVSGVGESTDDRIARIQTDNLQRDYCGNYLYTDGKEERVLTPTGYMQDSVYYHYIKDYLGNNRAVVSDDGFFEGMACYYPYGGAFADLRYDDRYLFGGKELETSSRLNLYDFAARQMDPTIGSFTTPDPLCERKYDISPYIYCLANPINLIDPSGMDEWEINEKGQVVSHVKTDKHDAFYIVDNKGHRSDSKSIILPYGTVKESKSDLGESPNNYDMYEVAENDNGTQLFEFLAGHTNVEWNQIKTGENVSFLTTAHLPNKEYGQSDLLNGKLKIGYKILELNHSHPIGTSYPSGLIEEPNTDISSAKAVHAIFGNSVKFNIYIPSLKEYINYSPESTIYDFPVFPIQLNEIIVTSPINY